VSQLPDKGIFSGLFVGQLGFGVAMSKLSFRARALDATKPLPIYNAVDLPDLSEYNTINRTVPQMPTGMEKEEETVRCLAPKRPPFLNPPF
jgi:enhancer of polycomb-like protein